MPAPDFDIQPGHVAAAGAFDVQPGHLAEGGSAGGAFVEHGANAALMGFGDEMVGGYKAVAKKLLPESLGGAPAGTPISDTYREDRDAVRARLAAEQKEHPVASVAGDIVGGSIPALAVPGAATATIGRAAATGAVMGGVAGLGNSNADDLAGMAEDTAKGASIGGASGGAGKYVGDKIIKGAGAIADELRDLSERKAVNALRPTATEVKSLIQQGKLGELGDWLLQHKVVEAGDTFSDIAAKAEGVKAGAGKALEDALGQLDATGKTIPKLKLAQAFQDLADEARAKGPGAEPLVNKYMAAAEDVMKRPEENLTFSQAEQWKRGFQDRVNYGRLNPTAMQQGDKELAGAARRVVEDEAGAAAEGTPAAETFLAAKGAYGKAAQAGNMAEGALGRQEARNVASPSDKATALGTFLTATALGHPVAGAVGGLAVGAANKLVRDRAASTIAVGARAASEKIADLATRNPAALGRWGAILGSAMQRSREAYNANYFTLMQTDAGFRDQMSKLEAE